MDHRVSGASQPQVNRAGLGADLGIDQGGPFACNVGKRRNR